MLYLEDNTSENLNSENMFVLSVYNIQMKNNTFHFDIHPYQLFDYVNIIKI